ncbi:hypothetical protein G5V59_02755 [Nocardioides sp. W3-2-3]|uniref:hypothetical protein n=1 Tax=Nocardioides convexus TaxID=2712224 RepID=UPI002418ACE0|nr:hypothetical protein [Nocardioides convexus]NGZ99671.1 hypothetical protein [Nocardioides convexus]
MNHPTTSVKPADSTPTGTPSTAQRASPRRPRSSRARRPHRPVPPPRARQHRGRGQPRRLHGLRRRRTGLAGLAPRGRRRHRQASRHRSRQRRVRHRHGSPPRHRGPRRRRLGRVPHLAGRLPPRGDPMNAQQPERDDLMAIADAVGITRPQPAGRHPDFAVRFIPHPSRAHEFTNLALGLRIRLWAVEATVLDALGDRPIALIPTDHDVCHGCADILCGCETQCGGIDRDVCSHDGKPYCPTCAPHHCRYCADDEARWGR